MNWKEFEEHLETVYQMAFDRHHFEISKSNCSAALYWKGYLDCVRELRMKVKK